MPTTIPCKTCGGTGRAPISKKLQHVLDQFKGGVEMTVDRVIEGLSKAEKAQINPTSVNNRMERLRKMKLLKRRREGRAWLYRTV